MNQNRFLKILCSLPILLLMLYFLPFLGICLLILRCFIYSNRKRITTPIILIVVAILILIPKGLNIIFNMIKFDSSVIPYYEDIMNAEIYVVDLIKYSKFLLTVGVIFLILSVIFSKLFYKLQNFISSYIRRQEQREYKISKKNDLIMKEKREQAKNTHVVYCPYCGADNLLTSNIGTCKYCRRKIQVKEKQFSLLFKNR